MNVLNKPVLSSYSSRKHNVYPGSLKQNRTFRLSEGTRLSMEKIHHHVLQFVVGTRNFYGGRVSVGCSEKFFILRKLIFHPQKFVAACYLQTFFVLACHLNEVVVTFALC